MASNGDEQEHHNEEEDDDEESDEEIMVKKRSYEKVLHDTEIATVRVLTTKVLFLKMKIANETSFEDGVVMKVVKKNLRVSDDWITPEKEKAVIAVIKSALSESRNGLKKIVRKAYGKIEEMKINSISTVLHANTHYDSHCLPS